MPIRKDLRKFYTGPEWEEARERTLERAGHKCEQCGKPNYAWIFTYTWKSRMQWSGEWLYHMIWIQEGLEEWRTEHGFSCSPWRMHGLPRRVQVLLGVAHADHNPANRSDDNLRCWCPWCHFRHDAPKHKDSRCIRKDAQREIIAYPESRMEERA
jgi:hypothetical protein